MFFSSPQRLAAMREMILANDAAQRQRSLAKLLPWQREDFEGIFEAMDGLPVTVRLLDPPLHEFLPRDAGQQQALARQLGMDARALRQRIFQLREANPMLGHRGCRLAMTYPEIPRMQVRALLEAAAASVKRGIVVRPEVMTPLVMDAREMRVINAIIDEMAGEVMRDTGTRLRYRKGAMIELPRAALLADELARECDFLSFGTNDLTQMMLGISRDDAGQFLPAYLRRGILVHDPFQSLDGEGVGLLMRIAVEKGAALARGSRSASAANTGARLGASGFAMSWGWIM